MLEYKVKINESVFIRWQGTSLDTGLFPRVKIYNIDSPTTVVATLDLPHLSKGLYGYKWTPTAAGKYFTQTIIYSTDYGVDESGIDRPDSDSINVEETSGAGGYLLGSGSRIESDKYKGLTDEEIKKIAESVYEKLVPELIKVEDIKIDIPQSFDYSDESNVIKDKISKIKFDYKFDDTLIISALKELSSRVDVNSGMLMSAVERALNREIKIEKNITNVLEKQIGEDGEDEDLMVAKDIISNPKKRFSYAKSNKLNQRVINYLLCLKGSC